MDAFIANLHFVRPLWLLGCVPALLLFLLLWFMRVRSSGWHKAIDSSLLPHLLDGQQGKQQGWPVWMLLFAWLTACLSLAGPVWEKLPQPVQKKTDALVLIQDMSLSFYAQDLSPNRLVRAQQKLADILKSRNEGTTALIVYSGDAHIVSPLTDDSKTIAAMVSSLSPGIMPTYGSNIVSAVELALRLLKDAGVSQGKILLVTDEVSEEDSRNVSKFLRGKNIVLSVLGIGTTDGGPIPKQDGGFLKDDAGKIIVPRLNSHVLRDLAAENGGRYSDITLDDQDIRYLLAAESLVPHGDEFRQIDREFDQWKEMGPWLVLLILPIALLAFRRGWILVFIVAVSLWSQDSHAMSWQDMWQRKDQQAAKALEKKDPEKAAQLFQTPSWKGVAEYQAGKFSDAGDAFANEEGADNLYNRGNALAKAGKYEDALKAYEKALQINPEMEDAKFNKELVEKVVQQQKQHEQKKQQNNDQKQKSGDKGQQDKDRQPQDKGQQGKQGQGKDRQSQEQGQKQDKQGAAKKDQRSQGQPQKHEQGQQGKSQSEGERQGTAAEQNMGDAPRQNEEKNVESSPKLKEKSVEEKKQPGEEKKLSGSKTPAKSPGERQAGAAMSTTDDAMPDEEKQALEQWLRQVPDDPGGLLRRKFEYESQVNGGHQAPRQKRKIW